MPDNMKYCPKCGKIIYQTHLHECDFCKSHLKETTMTFDEWNAMEGSQKFRWQNHLIESVIKQQEEFDETEYKAQIHEQVERVRHNSTNSSTVKCPRCGSTSFQMVPRRWSAFSGFLTNKVDRVCTNCKTRF